MREIKFRAKAATTNRWVYGHYAFTQDYHVIYEDGVPFVIALNTLGQYTGLKDKNGVEIYEGDIVHLTSDEGVNYNTLIVFKDGGFCAIDGTESDYGFRRYDLSRFDLYLEVIGDIYENPELLEREAE